MSETTADPAAGRRKRLLIGVSVLAVIALIAALAVFLRPAGSDEADEGNGDDAAPEDVEYGGTLNVAFDVNPDNYDPHQRPQLPARAVSRNIADTLTDQDPETGEILPWLAEDWEINEDATEFTFFLRDDVTFSDGTPLDAEVVKANFDRIIEIGPLAFVAAGLLRGYEESEVIDEHTVTVRFEEPNAQFLQATAVQSLSILAPATLELDPEEVAAGNVIGSGPYTLESYDPNDGIRLAVREDYAWGSPLYENQGRAYFDEVEISFIEESTTLAGAVSSGQIDYAYRLSAESVPGLEGSQAELHPTVMPAISIPIVPLVYSDVFSDENARKALNYATDREAIVDSVFQGLYEPATGVLTPSNPGYADLSDVIRYDPEEAERLLEEAGWTEIGEDGIRQNADGDRLEIEIQYTGTSYEAMFQLLQQQWAQVGIDFVLTPVSDLSDYTIHNYEFDLTTWSQTRADPDVLRTVYSSFYESQSFLYGHPDEEIDDLLGELQTTTDEDDRLAVSEEVQRLIIDRGYTVPLFDLTQFAAYHQSIGGTTADLEGKPAFVDFYRVDE
ncbi:ABC transporter substrate-binding protein [Nesterenkonia alkaliphila]|uniref:ABC transporter substrate-binding protein n=1 Tax=Nesterenkonia alkaliphila TaxID=1463631 RepID=A0A7K1ULC5_9MICC|nr:ABC transporter substrate-binding protein [Nesterenkonia alkaliphila]MVT27224.1 ABC transporter substrate-binding protein [Nesterenkonia alkaliphila]GFZ78473.1 peptide ABC transporter permease [Nesterenkonia alkaliphila]